MIYYYIKIAKHKIIWIWWAMTVRMFCKNVAPTVRYGDKVAPGCKKKRFFRCSPFICQKCNYGKE